MTKIYRIPTGQVEGNGANDTNTSEIRPYGEIAVYIGDNNKLELLMFDGVRTHVRSKVLNKGTFYGGDADSADGAGYDSIKLVPDEELRRGGSQQYIIVEPTGGEPGHVHIRAGGTIDSSTADLFLGGELNHVRVSDTNNSVKISTDDGLNTGTTKQWTFDAGGGLTLPADAGIIGQGGIALWGQGEMSSTAYINLPNNEDAASTYLTIGNYSNAGVLIQTGTTNPPKNFLFKGNGDLDVPGSIINSNVAGLGLKSNYSVQIVADYTDNNHQWTFDGSTAELTVPGTIRSQTNPSLGTQIPDLPYTLGAGNANGYVGIGVEWAEVATLGDLTGYTLTAQQTGSTIFTTTIAQMRDDLGGQPAFQTADPLPGYAADITFTITSPGYVPQSIDNLELAAGTNTWTFSSTTGDLTLPAGGDIKNSSGNSVLSVQGENLYPMDGTNTDITVTELDFNLLVASTSGGYSGSATHNVNLPAGALGQRLVVVNTSNSITLTVNSIYQVTQASSPAEFIYTSGEGWIPLYGATVAP